MYFSSLGAISANKIPGVGPQKLKYLNKLGISNLEDMLSYFPRTYDDWSYVQLISDCPLDTVVTVHVTVKTPVKAHLIRKGMSLFKTTVYDDSGELRLTFFNTPFIQDVFVTEKQLLLHGKIAHTQYGYEMTSPEYEVLDGKNEGRIVPVYSLTNGLSNKMMGKMMSHAIMIYGDNKFDPLPQYIREEFNLAHQLYALENVHNPTSFEALAIARKRLAFEELLVLQLGLWLLKYRRLTLSGALCDKNINMQRFYSSLPYELTGAQMRSIDEILNDMSGKLPMNRLLQGDVSSGKTVVAAAAIYFTVQNGYQSAMMVPTEILAVQHFKSLQEQLGKLNVRSEILTSSVTAKARRDILAKLASGEIDFIVGTQSLIQSDVEYKRLGLVVADEQHRFGVRQRSRLTEKGENPHTLIMSATPIPRTLALMIYGDLDVSLLDEYPKGRQNIDTFLIDSDKRNRALNFVLKDVQSGGQAYFVCPTIEQDEESELKSVLTYAEELKTGVFSNVTLAIIHGKMKAKEKDDIMSRFTSGEVKVLVSTTVIEVGVNVPNATMMVVENAERFGLSQLHQLRGRVGRGERKSYCILVSDNQSDETKQRLLAMTKTNNGFELAEMDLKLRGPGDFFGNKQHGLPELKIADMITDVALLQQAKLACDKIFADDSTLEKDEHHYLKEYIHHMFNAEGNIFN